MIRMEAVQASQRELLWNINQKYLYEMTNYYDDPMDEEGNYHYGHFDEYFSDPRRKAFFLYNEETLVGFAMLCPYSYINRDTDYTLAEFTIFPAFRKNNYAMEASARILSRYSGRWEIKYNENNTAAKKLWNKVAAPYEPETVRLNEVETVLIFNT